MVYRGAQWRNIAPTSETSKKRQRSKRARVPWASPVDFLLDTRRDVGLTRWNRWNIGDSRVRIGSSTSGINSNTKLYRDRSLSRDTLPLWHNYAGPVSRLHCHFYTSSSSSSDRTAVRRKPGNTHTVETDLFIVIVVVVDVVIMLLFLVCPDVTDDNEKSPFRLACAIEKRATYTPNRIRPGNIARTDGLGEWRSTCGNDEPTFVRSSSSSMSFSRIRLRLFFLSILPHSTAFIGFVPIYSVYLYVWFIALDTNTGGYTRNFFLIKTFYLFIYLFFLYYLDKITFFSNTPLTRFPRVSKETTIRIKIGFFPDGQVQND